MGLTPLEGLIGGTRCGTIDPTAIFHHTPDGGADAGLQDIKVTKAEVILNKESGLKALAGTTNFGTITSGMAEDDKLRRAYNIYLDRLMGYLSQYLFKLLSVNKTIDGIVFSGGIGEKSDVLRRDVLEKLKWLGVKVSQDEIGGHVSRLTSQDSAIAGWVVETDEEGWCEE
jgi:acetate kinase